MNCDMFFVDYDSMMCYYYFVYTGLNDSMASTIWKEIISLSVNPFFDYGINW